MGEMGRGRAGDGDSSRPDGPREASIDAWRGESIDGRRPASTDGRRGVGLGGVIGRWDDDDEFRPR